MSTEKDKRFIDIEDPLSAFDKDEAEEIAEEISEEEQTAEKPANKLSPVIDKAREILRPVTDTAEKKLSVKTAAIILGAVLVAAAALAVLFFSLYSNAVYTSERSVDDWAKEWNEMEFTDNCKYLYEDFITLKMDTMLNSDTDHVYLTEEDIKALKKGESVKLLDDLAELSVDTYKGDFMSASMKIDYTKMSEFYFGENYASDSSLTTYEYMPAPNHDVAARALAYIGLMMNPLNDMVNTDSEMFTVSLSLNMSSPHSENGDAYASYGDYTYILSSGYENFLTVTSSSDASGSDISASDMKVSVEPHYIYYITAVHSKTGEKKHAADWSWWNDIFPKKDKSEDADNILPNTEISASDISSSDISATDVSAADTDE